MKNVLIAGGSGYIGREISSHLESKGYHVAWLSRNSNIASKYNVFIWNPEKGIIDPQSIVQANFIINLAGTSIGQNRWNKKYKQQILESRILSSNLLVEAIFKYNPSISALIQASAVGYYGIIDKGLAYTEEDPPGEDFLADVCVQWESTIQHLRQLDVRTITLRLGTLMNVGSSAYQKMANVAKLGFSAPFGTGKQFFSITHIEDVKNVLTLTLFNTSITGPINVVSAPSMRQKDVCRLMAKHFGFTWILPGLPKWLLSFLVGEFSNYLVAGVEVVPKVLLDLNFHFAKFEWEK